MWLKFSHYSHLEKRWINCIYIHILTYTNLIKINYLNYSNFKIIFLHEKLIEPKVHHGFSEAEKAQRASIIVINTHITCLIKAYGVSCIRGIKVMVKAWPSYAEGEQERLQSSCSFFYLFKLHFIPSFCLILSMLSALSSSNLYVTRTQRVQRVFHLVCRWTFKYHLPLWQKGKNKFFSRAMSWESRVVLFSSISLW